MIINITRQDIASLNLERIQEIDRFTKNNCGLIFHETEFNRIVSEVFGTRLSYLIARGDRDVITGCCPLHTIKKNWVKLTYSNPGIFEVPYGGWITSRTGESDLLKKLLGKTGHYIAANECLTYVSSIHVREDLYEGMIPDDRDRQTVVIDLSSPAETIWEKVIHSKKRNKIRKAENSGVQVHFFGAEGLDIYYPLMMENYRQWRLKAKPIEFYRELLDFYFPRKQAVIILAEHKGEYIAGIFVIGNLYMVHYWQGIKKRAADSLGQGELLQWTAIKWALDNGCHYYDLCIIDEYLPHIAAFKLGFSKTKVPYYLFRYKPLTYKILNRINKWLG